MPSSCCLAKKYSMNVVLRLVRDGSVMQAAVRPTLATSSRELPAGGM